MRLFADIFNITASKMYKGTTADDSRMFMSAITDFLNIEPTKQINIKLSRSVTRIDVGVGSPQLQPNLTFVWNGLQRDGVTVIPFELKSVHVARPYNKYSIIPLLYNYRDFAALKPSVPTTAVRYNFSADRDKFLYQASDIIPSGAGTGSYTTQQIYMPEADIAMGGIVGDANHETRAAIIVGGSYNGNPVSYYRLDFTDSNKKLMDALRNNLYQFNILSVSGNGYPTPEEAYKSVSMNITASVVEWSEEQISNIEFDGSHYFSLTTKSVSF